jgi:hypothetical protein
MKNLIRTVLVFVSTVSSLGYSKNKELYTFKNSACVNANGEEGLNPPHSGTMECVDYRGIETPHFIFSIETSLRGSDLRGVNLKDLVGYPLHCHFEGAIFDKTTTLPFPLDKAFRLGMIYIDGQGSHYSNVGELLAALP